MAEHSDLVPTIGARANGGRSTMRIALIVLGQALLVATALYVFLQGWRRDFGVPLTFSSDGLLALMQSKSTVDNGWWWFNPLLGAPFGLDELAFPANSNVDQAIVWTVSRFVRHTSTAINLAWMLMVVLSGLSASWCLRVLGASTSSSIVAGTLFALSPYALYRNIDHLWMVIYLVPFACTAALLLASGQLSEREPRRAPHFFILIGCALLGFNYVYYAFFGCFLLAVASVAGFVACRRWRNLMAGGVCIAVITGCTLLNLAPSLYSWKQHGRPFILRDKVPAESEVYGLKIRQLVSPVFEHSFPPFRAWTRREGAAQFPIETENMSSRLGLVGTVGFLGLLSLLLVPTVVNRSDIGRLLSSASQLTLAAVLLGTVGGFGSLFSLLVSPQIRAYNRISPFIAFFALAAVALAIDSLLDTRARRRAAGLIVLVLGLADQHMASAGLNAAHAGIAAEIPGLQAFVRDLESRLPDRAMVLQLPFRTYLTDSGIARMQPYDHLKLYMVSTTIRWSYPALSNDQVNWQLAAAGMDPGRLARQVAAEGFAAILVDRYGYDDNGAAVTAAIRETLGRDGVVGETARYTALDVRALASGGAPLPPLAKAPRASTLEMDTCGAPPLMNIEQVGGATAPFAGGPLRVGSGELKVSGWAVDQVAGTQARGVDILLDDVPFPTIYGADRGDVVEYFKRQGYLQSGFVAVIPAGQIGKGQHTIALRVVSSEGQCYYQAAGRAIIVD
jgi:hypothetical protein